MSEPHFGANTLGCEWFLSMAFAVMFYLVPFQFCFTVIVLLGVRLEVVKMVHEWSDIFHGRHIDPNVMLG